MILALYEFLVERLNNSLIIKNKIKIFYVQAFVNSSFPYIYLGDFHSKDISTKDKQGKEIFFKLHIFFRDQNLKEMLKIAKDIEKLMRIDNEGQVVLMRLVSEFITQHNDGMTQQITMNFRAVLA